MSRKYEPPAITLVLEEDYSDEDLTRLSSQSPAATLYGAADPDYSQFQTVLRQQYGFRKDCAVLISRIWDKLASIQKQPYMASYMFYRMLGGIVYGNSSLGSIAWSSIAGTITGATDSTSAMKNYLMSYVELSASEVSELFNEIIEQHKNSYKTAVAGEDGRFCAKPDFAHFCITVAARFAGKLGMGALGNAAVVAGFSYITNVYGIVRTREYLAGWLGGLVLDDHKMGRDDYAADADALYFCDGIDDAGSYRVEPMIFVRYFGVQSKVVKKRVEIYKDMLDIDDAAEVVGLCLVSDTFKFDASSLIIALEDQGNFPDVLRFFKVAKGRVAEPSCSLYLD